MEDASLLMQTLLMVIALPFLAIFYWYLGFRAFALFIRTVKTIWNGTN